MGRKNKKDKTGSDGSGNQGRFTDRKRSPGADDDDAGPLDGIYIPPPRPPPAPNEGASPNDSNSSSQGDSNKDDNKYEDLIQEYQGTGVDTPLFNESNYQEKILKANESFDQVSVVLPADLTTFKDDVTFLEYANSLPASDPRKNGAINTVHKVQRFLHDAIFPDLYRQAEMTISLSHIIQDDPLLKMKLSLNDLDQSRLTDNNKSLQLSLWYIDGQYLLFCQYQDEFKWKCTFDFSIFNTMTILELEHLLGNKAHFRYVFAFPTKATGEHMMKSVTSLPLPIVQFEESYNLIDIFNHVFGFKDVTRMDGNYHVFKVMAMIGFQNLTSFHKLDMQMGVNVLRAFKLHGVPQDFWIFPFALQAMIVDLVAHCDARARDNYVPLANDLIMDPIEFFKHHLCDKEFKQYRKSFSIATESPHVCC